jgi:hypothetical protein
VSVGGKGTISWVVIGVFSIINSNMGLCLLAKVSFICFCVEYLECVANCTICVSCVECMFGVF